MRHTSHVVLWGARTNDIQLGGSTDRATQINEQLDRAIAAGYDSVRRLGEMLNPLDVADQNEWGHAG